MDIQILEFSGNRFFGKKQRKFFFSYGFLFLVILLLEAEKKKPKTGQLHCDVIKVLLTS